ncbi:hypothetical protein CC78DRAFT_612357 [Lojkania enalia]|uniref:Uncharacterized protein n=1 Tax=Lojkania enalia TaxID=147567 RepID=A0A9P4NA18_9PLEO|nr:hypothetical protein CC78DRAFT_612357 [Didymosphaeria enalia]
MTLQDGITRPKTWQNSDIIELIALILTVPGALAALATFWILLGRRRKRRTLRLRTSADPTIQLPNNFYTSSTHSNNDTEDATTRRATGWFQEQYYHLADEVAAERASWAEEC